VPGDLSLQTRRAIGNQALERMFGPIQAKLEIGGADDPLEHETDRAAGKVLSMSDPPAEPPLPAGQSVAPPREMQVPATVRDALWSSGQPLDASTRGFFEPRFQQGFSGVRVHTGAQAQAAAEMIGARAFTAGREIVFGRGEFAPESPKGRELLAHELAHVVQQGASSPEPVVRRQAQPQSPSQLQDPIQGTELPGFGFWATGPDFQGPPLEQDIRQVLIEQRIADEKTLGECVVNVFQIKGGHDYFAYIHPTLGVAARAYAQLFNPADPKSHEYSVYAYVADNDVAKHRPVGGPGEKRQPSLGPLSEITDVRFADLDADLRLIDTRLASLLKRYSGINFDIAIAAATAQKQVRDIHARLTADPNLKATITTALQIVEWSDEDLALIDPQRQALADKGNDVKRVDQLLGGYRTVLEKLFTADAMAAYNSAQTQAGRLPADILLDALRAHGQLNAATFPNGPAAALVAWVDDLRGLYDAYSKNLDSLSANPNDLTLKKTVGDQALFLGLSVRGIELFARNLVAFEGFVKNRPGIFDLPLIAAMSRLNDRAGRIKDAYFARDPVRLKTTVEGLEGDPAVAQFYQALPAAMQVTELVARIAVSLLAAEAAGGVGGLVSGGARTAATGITVRTAARFLGTAVLEAGTFTAVNTAASVALFGDKVAFGSLLKDFAWNVGLFVVLGGATKGSTAVLRAAELEAISGPVNLGVGFPLAHAYGILRFRIERNRWPNSAELDLMTTEAVLLMAGVALGSRGAQRWLQARKQASALTIFYREYGWRYEALDSLRSTLSDRVAKAEDAGKGNDQAEVDSAKADAKTLEQKIQELLDAALKDKRFDVAQIRKELNELREAAPDVAANLISDTLGIPAEAGVRRPSSASYTYSNGKTSVLEGALSGQYTVTKSSDPTSGLKTVTATSPKAPTLIFQERAAGALDFDTSQYDVQKLMLDLSLTTPESQRMLWRLLNDNGIAKDPKQATTTTRRQVKDLAKKAGKTEEETLGELNKRGRLRARAASSVAAAAESLEKSGVLDSPEWLEARTEETRRGVAGEWLAKESTPAPTGSRVFRRVEVTGDLFEDAAGTIPAKDPQGKPRVNATAAESDLVYGRDVSGAVEVDTVINVKASGEKGMSKSAGIQNANFQAVLSSKPGDLVRLQLSDGIRFVRVKSITALEGTAAVDLTGKLTPAASLGVQTAGPRGAGGFSAPLALTQAQISEVSAILYESQLIRSGVY
jgi:hypothetical protein